MKKIMILFLIIYNFSFAARVIVLATDPFPPFHSPEKSDCGFFAEIVKESFSVGGYELKIEFVSWSRALELGKTGVYDGVIGALYSDERAKSFLYSDSVYKYGRVLFTRKDIASSKKEFDKLKKLKFGKVKGYYYPVEKDFLQQYTVMESSSIENNLKALINKRVDFIIESSSVIDNFLKNGYKDYADEIMGIDVLSEKDFYIMLSKEMKDYEKVMEDFNKGLKKIKSNGTYNKVLKKYGIGVEE